MRTSFIKIPGRKLSAVLLAALLPVATANAWWGGYGPGGWGCDPQWAYMEEYGFLDPYGPSRSDLQRLNRDEWRHATGHRYYGGYTTSEAPVEKAMRRRCHGGYRHAPYWW